MTQPEDQHLSLLMQTVTMHVVIAGRPYSPKERLEHVRLAMGLLRQAEGMMSESGKVTIAWTAACGKTRIE